MALYRPGPMDDIPKYINVKGGKERADYLHPSLEPILRETFGIMVYQEQVMQIAQELSGFTLGSADLLRRAMGKKIRAEMEAQRKAFVEGAVVRGVDHAQAEGIFEKVNKFAGYGFNKCHSAPYAMIAYQTAYLKANYPVEFFAASMSYDIGNTDKLNLFRQELQRLGIKLLPPDVNRSEVVFAVEPVAPKAPGDGMTTAIRYALAAVKNVGRQAMAGLVAEREARGPFRSLGDLAERLDARLLNKRQLESLVAAGAFDSLNPNRHQTFEAVEQILRYSGLAASDRASNQGSLFATLDGASAPAAAIALAPLPDWPAMERLKREFDAIGFYLSAHPLDAYGKTLERLGVISAVEAEERLLAGRGAARVRLAGTPIARQERTAKSGNRFAFLQLSDMSGVFEVMLFSEVLSAARELIDQGVPLLIAADGRLDGEQVRYTAQTIEPLDKAAANVGASLRIYLSDPAPVESLKRLLEREARGKGRIWLVAMSEGRETEIALAGRYSCSPPLRQAIKALGGVVQVEEV